MTKLITIPEFATTTGLSCVRDPDAALLVTELFEGLAEGRHSLRALVREMNADALRLRGRKLHSGLVH